MEGERGWKGSAGGAGMIRAETVPLEFLEFGCVIANMVVDERRDEKVAVVVSFLR